jgi:hypothetical protein
MRCCFRVCIFPLLSCLLHAQENAGAHTAGRDDSIRLEVLEGDGAINSIRLHRAHDVIVKVTGSGGAPVAGATITFHLPVSGPSAVFPEGMPNLTVESDEQGIAAAKGLRPNSLPGQFQIRVSASLHGTSAESTLSQTNAEAAIQSGHTKLIVILVAVGGAAAAGAALALHGKSSSTSSASSGGGSISAGVPIFGPPH